MPVVTILVGEAHHFAIDALRFTQHTLQSIHSKRCQIHFLTKFNGIHLFSIRYQERTVGTHSYQSSRNTLPATYPQHVTQHKQCIRPV